MVTHPGAPQRAERVQLARPAVGGRRSQVADGAEHLLPHTVDLIPVNLPVPVAVERGVNGEPAAVEWRGRWVDVDAVLDRWRVDDEWWREEISRLYRRVVLADERVLTVFEDLLSGRWYVQRYRLRAGAAPAAKRRPRAARRRR